MPTTKVNGATLYWEMRGEHGDPLVLVHGSWPDSQQWDAVADRLSDRFRVLTFDRRGHGRSSGAPGEAGVIDEDVLDVAGLVEELALAPAHIGGNSFGASIVLRLACRRPDLFRTLMAHEPPLFGLLADDPEMEPVLAEVQSRISAIVELIRKGDNARAAEQFVESVALGPGEWAKLPQEIRDSFIANAATFAQETEEPGAFELDLSRLSGFDHPALLSHGGCSPPFLPVIVPKVAAALPRAKVHTFAEAGHIPHFTHPEVFASVTAEAMDASRAAR
jgi:pimeloyl-ACP methyl ester carboxylesterase